MIWDPVWIRLGRTRKTYGWFFSFCLLLCLPNYSFAAVVVYRDNTTQTGLKLICVYIFSSPISSWSEVSRLILASGMTSEMSEQISRRSYTFVIDYVMIETSSFQVGMFVQLTIISHTSIDVWHQIVCRKWLVTVNALSTLLIDVQTETYQFIGRG